MSIVKSSGGTASVPQGSVHLFASPAVPDGYERLARMIVPAAAYATSQRITLLDTPLGAAAPDYHFFNDSTSDEHIYVAYSSTLRRLHLPSGTVTPMPSPPKDLGTGGLYVTSIATKTGAIFYSAGSTGSATLTNGYRFNCETEAWTTIAAAPAGMGVTLAYDDDTDSVYQLSGYSYRSTGNVQSLNIVRLDLTSNTSATVTDAAGAVIELPAAANSGQAVVMGREIIYTGSGLRVVNLDTGITSTIALPSGSSNSVMSLYKLSPSRALFAIAGAFYVLSKNVDGKWVTTSADIAGVGSGKWQMGVRGCSYLRAPVGGGILLHYDPTTAADVSLLGLLMLDGLADAPNANLFYARKL